MNRKNGLKRNVKGSSVYGAIFVVIIVVIFANYFFVVLAQNSLFAQGVQEQMSSRLDQLDEVLDVTNVNYSVEDDLVIVTLSLKNSGSSVVQLVNLWIIDSNINNYGYNDGINILINPGDTLVFNDTGILSVEIAGAVSSDDFTSWFMSTRGNKVPIEIDAADSDGGDTYYYTNMTNPPEWWLETSNPIVIIPDNSELDGTDLYLSVLNRSGTDINIDMLVCTRIIEGSVASSKVEIIPVNWTISAETEDVIAIEVDRAVVNGDGLRVELVSAHNWVVGCYVFLYNE